MTEVLPIESGETRNVGARGARPPTGHPAGGATGRRARSQAAAAIKCNQSDAEIKADATYASITGRGRAGESSVMISTPTTVGTVTAG
eukprot:3184169-Pleurochrysis_carterae.AAC.3